MENQTWTEMKSKIKSRWAKLTDENIEAVKNDLSSLKGQLETTYGYSKEFALKEFNQLMGKSGEGVAKPVEASVKMGSEDKGTLKFGAREEKEEKSTDESVSDQSENKHERTFGGRNENKSESKSKSRDDKASEQFARDRH
jgi:uncharacterized protein YjbJ (UPF0337 family)